jgi:hypothetical protein
LRYYISRFSQFFFSCEKYQESDHVSITKVVVLSTTNPTKLVWHFSEISTIFYAFYKFLQKGCTIEDVSLRLGPWKDSGPCNWVPRPTGRRTRRKSGGSGGAPDRGTARGQLQAHLGWVDGLGSGGGVVGVGVRRRPHRRQWRLRVPARRSAQMIICIFGRFYES